ncbi:WhiB family transcriptional regulator [Streptomyces sp. NPDC004520]|uniref:WhiB family transcriptional regulator n=1 Tax=Streptomyces sp. NPDC004520 TaxID=3364702 RepID=UPI00369B8839
MSAWRLSAACAGTPWEVFFPIRGDAKGRKAAQAVCAGCPVREECLAEALAEEGGLGTNSRYGIRGGKTPTGRHALYARAAKAQRAA